MRSLSLPQQRLIATVLILLMALTRGQHFATLTALPSASWAIFFLAGLYLSSGYWFVLLMVVAVALDLSAIFWGGVSSYCLSPAYSLLLPAYGSLWLAGKWYRHHLDFNLRSLLLLVASLLVATSLATLFSSGGFYLFSGRYTHPELSGLISNLTTYLPTYLANVSFYMLVAVLIHAVCHFKHLQNKLVDNSH